MREAISLFFPSFVIGRQCFTLFVFFWGGALKKKKTVLRKYAPRQEAGPWDTHGGREGAEDDNDGPDEDAGRRRGAETEDDRNSNSSEKEGDDDEENRRGGDGGDGGCGGGGDEEEVAPCCCLRRHRQGGRSSQAPKGPCQKALPPLESCSQESRGRRKGERSGRRRGSGGACRRRCSCCRSSFVPAGSSGRGRGPSSLATPFASCF